MATFDHIICVILVVVGTFHFDVTTCHKWPNLGMLNWQHVELLQIVRCSLQIIQRNTHDGMVGSSEYWYLKWKQYKQGFGAFTQNFWLG